MSRNSDTRVLLFKKYAENLRMVLSSFSDLKPLDKLLYLCPLCIRAFDYTALDQTCHNSLTIEHIPPGAVGGKEVVLTCKKCNNMHGELFDSELSKKAKLFRTIKGKDNSFISTSFLVNDSIKTDGIIEFPKPEELVLSFQRERTNPIYYKSIENLIQNPTFNFSFRHNIYNEKKASFSLLRAAYLKAFKQLGYAYLLTKESNEVRNGIMNYDPEEKRVRVILLGRGMKNKEGLNIITSPKVLRGYLVTFNLNFITSGDIVGILLPGNQKHSGEFYSSYEALVKDDVGIELSCTNIDEIDFFNAANCLKPYTLW